VGSLFWALLTNFLPKILTFFKANVIFFVQELLGSRCGSAVKVME
jgi:hypothetical protein